MSQALFYSSIETGLDSKGRAALPADFRETFAASETVEVQSRLYLVRRDLPDAPLHLACFGRQLIEGLATELDYCDEGRAHVIETILAQTDMVRFDAAGRFSLGTATISALGLKDKVVFVGAGRFFEIWHPNTVTDSATAQMSAYRSALRRTMAASRSFVEGGGL